MSGPAGNTLRPRHTQENATLPGAGGRAGGDPEPRTHSLTRNGWLTSLSTDFSLWTWFSCFRRMMSGMVITFRAKKCLLVFSWTSCTRPNVPVPAGGRQRGAEACSATTDPTHQDRQTGRSDDSTPYETPGSRHSSGTVKLNSRTHTASLHSTTKLHRVTAVLGPGVTHGRQSWTIRKAERT